MPSLSEAEEAYTALPGGTADISHLQAERQRSRMRLSSVARLEQVSSPRLASSVCIDILPYLGCKKIVPYLLRLSLQEQMLPASKRISLSGLRGNLCSAAVLQCCMHQVDCLPKVQHSQTPSTCVVLHVDRQ